MGKYMRKCRGAVGEEVAAMEATQAVGVRTRSRAAAVATKRRRPLPPSPLRASHAAAVAAASPLQGAGESGSCYLKLRSRMLFMAPPQPSTATPAHGAEAGHGPAALAAGLSRCSSTASSVDASSVAQDRSLPCRSDAAEAGSDNVRRGSASDDSESGRGRERRETTPSSHQLPGELSDLESDLAGRNRSRSVPSALTSTQDRQAAARTRMPAAAEIEEFFAAAEEAEAKRFASKYNFDIARGVPLDAGRFEWAPAVSSSSC
uniref:Uncharacterized protein n=1 Tax=Avena sativa TaxID=4498 RepID=A0ACD5YR30_AVESA